MGLGIAYVASVHAKIPRIQIYDRSETQIQRSLALMDKLLAKDVQKGKMKDVEAKEARERVEVVPVEQGIAGLKDVDMVVEVRSTLGNLRPKFKRR